MSSSFVRRESLRASLCVSLLSALMLSACGGGGSGGSGGNTGGNNGGSNGGTPPTVTAPSNLSYTSPQTFIIGAAITPLSPTVTGTVSGYTVAPALPAGLALDATSGQISGTPTAATPAAAYTVTATNAGGSTTFALSLTIAPTLPAMPVVTLSFAPKRVNLAWTAAAGAEFYRVRKDSGGGYAQLGGDVTTQAASDVIPVHLTDWANTSYVVQACNASGCTDSAPRSLTAANSVGAAAYTKPASPAALAIFGLAVAVSEDGSTMAIGATGDASGSAGIDGDPSDTSMPGSGAVFVFARSGDGWVPQAYVKASNPGASDGFGVSIALSANGDTLAVGAHGESSNSAADPANDSASGAGAAYIFVRASGAWSQQAYLKAPDIDAGDSFGRSVALSGDGNVFVAGAMNEDSATATVNGDPTDESLASAGAAYVFVRAGTAWAPETYLKAHNPGLGDSFGTTVAVSGDGSTIAVGAPGEDSAATGIDGDGNDDTAADSGAVYVFRRSSPASWAQTAYLKASNANAGDVFGGVFGGFVVGIQRTIALSADGNTLAVGAFREASLTGAETDNSGARVGAVYVFTRAPDGLAFVWSQQAYVKAANRDANDDFGAAVALSADGNLLAVGATGEDGGAAGVGGTPDNTVADAGAVYLFSRSGADWSQRAYVKSANPGNTDAFGFAVALSGDGMTMAVGAPAEDSAGDDPADDSLLNPGAAYLY